MDISTDPHKLIDTIHSLTLLLETAIETKFDELQASVVPDHTGSKFQHRCHREGTEMVHEYGYGMRFPFRTRDDKIIVLLLYGPANYVYTFVREFEDLREACFDSLTPHEDWVMTGYHDSCWRDKVRNFLDQYLDQLTMVGFLRFGEKVKISAEMFEFISDKEKARRQRHRLSI